MERRRPQPMGFEGWGRASGQERSGRERKRLRRVARLGGQQRSFGGRRSLARSLYRPTMFQGPESDSARPSSRVLQPPGGLSSNLFGSAEVSSSSKSQKMASNIFAAAEEPMNFPKRTNPPGGKDSGIFEDHKPNASRQFINPPGGKTSNIFGTPSPVSAVKAHPNKPKDHTFLLKDRGDSPREPKVPEDQRPQREELCEKKDLPKEITKEPGPKIDDHEPRLGPRPRSHNKVLNPPGGKSSIAFY